MPDFATLYSGYTDDQLLTLHEDRANLTDAAQDALLAEIKSRRLDLPVPLAPGIIPLAPAIMPNPGEDDKDQDGLVGLITFWNGLDLGDACDHLEHAGIHFTVEQFPGDAQSPPYFQIRVHPAVRPQAEAVLRSSMGLFPLQESDNDGYTEGEGYIDDGSLVTLGVFEDQAEAEQTSTILSNAGIFHKLSAPSDREEEDDRTGYSVEVHATDLDRGLSVVAAALGVNDAP